LSHKHIVKTFDHGLTTNNEQFLVMELIEGIGLAYLVDVQNDAMKEHRLRIMVELGEALEYLHKENWIHRDLCPRNVLMDKEYSTKLIDFGLVVPNTKAFQEPGNRTGTANYMAPELIKRQRTDQRIDIFSYAITCFEMYCKELPWPSITGVTLEMMLKRINTKPRDIRELVPKLDDQIATAIMRGLEAEPQNRWQTVSAMLAELRQAYHRLEVPAPKAEEAKKRSKKRRDALDGKWQFKTQ
jgi:serine/threonine protein kinase